MLLKLQWRGKLFPCSTKFCWRIKQSGTYKRHPFHARNPSSNFIAQDVRRWHLPRKTSSYEPVSHPACLPPVLQPSQNPAKFATYSREIPGACPVNVLDVKKCHEHAAFYLQIAFSLKPRPCFGHIILRRAPALHNVQRLGLVNMLLATGCDQRVPSPHFVR